MSATAQATQQALTDAAQRRMARVQARADRPQKRRSDEHATGPARASARVRDMRIRADSGDDGGPWEFAGVATVYEHPYEMWDWFGPYTEIVSAGAGAETLARTDLDVPLVLQHQALRRIARTTNGSLTLTETADGLHVSAPALDPNDSDVRYIVPKLQSGLIDEMSFRFTITSGQWSPDYEEYRINSYDIHRGDVAIVGYGANPATSAGLRSPIDSVDIELIIKDLPDDKVRDLHASLTARLRSSRLLVTDDDIRLRTM